MPYTIRNNPRGSATGSPVSTWMMGDYSLGMNSYIGNDSFPVRNGTTIRLLGPNYWRLAQDARIRSIGNYETRQGFDYYSDAAGVAQDQSITATTGAADQAFSDTTRLAQKFTTTSAGNLTKLQVNIKNANSASGVVVISLYTDNAGSPGTLVASTSCSSSDMSSSYGYVTFRFAGAPALANSTTYWIVASVQPTVTNTYNWSSTTSATTAMVSTDSGVTWSATSYALNFKQFYATSGAVLGLFRATKSDGTKVTLMAQGTTLYTVNDSTGALTAIKTGLNAAATAYRFEIFNDVVYYVNGYDGYRKWDFTTESQVNATNYTMICKHIGLMFLAGGADPNAVIFSNFGLPEKFTSTDFIYADAPKTGDPVTALVSLNAQLMIFTRNDKFILSGSDNSTFSVAKAPDQKGTYTQETVCKDDNFMYFLSSDAIYQSNGTQPKMLSNNIYQEVFDMQDKATNIICINKGRLYLWHKSTGAAYNDSCYVINTNLPNAGTVESKDTNAYVARAINTPNDSDNMLVGSSIVGQAMWQELPSNDYHNMGGPLNFLLQTSYLTGLTPEVLKAYRKWEPRFGAKSSSYTIDCDFAYDLRDNWTTQSQFNVQGAGPIWGSGIKWGSFVWGIVKELLAELYIPGEYRYTAIRYKHSAMRQPHEFLGHSLMIQFRRMR